MKIEVNYDLISKIMEARHGVSLNNVLNRVSKLTLASWGFDNLLLDFFDTPFQDVFTYLAIYMSYAGLSSVLLSKLQKTAAIYDLRVLSRRLKDINVNTNGELIIDAYKYKTNYSVDFSGSFPIVKQDKYIMVPVYEGGQTQEMSILQEHNIGSNSYSLSCGTPEEEYKLALSLG